MDPNISPLTKSTDKSKLIIAAIALIAIVVGVYFLFVFQRKPKEISLKESEVESKVMTDIELAKRPFVTLTPTADGAEIIISIENMSNFDRMEYELTYLADNPNITGEKIQRGATGTDVNTKDPKYKKSMLLGTASRGVRSPDKGVTDGKLTLHAFKGNIEYLSETQWKLLQAGMKAENIEDMSKNLRMDLPALGKNYWIILTDTIGLPPGYEFKPENAILPTYGSFSVAGDFLKKAILSLKIQKDEKSPALYSYNHQDSKWTKLESSYDNAAKTFTSSIGAFSIFVAVSSQ